ncbi:MAG: cation-efflux pump [Candidatus Nitrosocaldus sp.]|nr:cation-efflux pump [Candidatus Nitrosocaldus sp.]MDW8000165.1 cation-efflux pump [Candidatus Nitrosocaldus sp.]
MLKPLQRMEQKRALSLSLVAIASVAVFEVIAGIASDSMAVLSDGIHASFDALLTAILLIMLIMSMKPRDMEHTYGHGRFETIAGLIGGIVLFMVAILIIMESLERVAYGEGITPSIIGLYALILALSVAVFRAVILAYSTHGISVRVGFYDAVADMGSSVAALLGFMLASSGLYAADGIASIALAGMIIFLTSRLVYSSAMELTDAIDPSLVDSARRAVLSIEGVKDCRDVRMRRVGRDILADVTVVLKGGITFSKAHAISTDVENAVMSSTSASRVMVHFEPESESEQPIEHLIADIASSVDGVKGVHNIMVSRERVAAGAGEGGVGGGGGIGSGRVEKQGSGDGAMIVSLHVQVDRNLRLDEAHRVADMVEHEVKRRIKDVKDVTVHMEPLMPEMLTLEGFKDRGLESKIRSIAYEHGIRHLGRVDAYTCDGMLRIDIHCSIDADLSIEEAHEIISRLERRIRDELGAVVTVHVEPYERAESV